MPYLTGQYTSDLTINIFQYLYNNNSTFDIIYFTITHSYNIWKLLSKSYMYVTVSLENNLTLSYSQLYKLWEHGNLLDLKPFFSANFNITGVSSPLNNYIRLLVWLSYETNLLV